MVTAAVPVDEHEDGSDEVRCLSDRIERVAMVWPLAQRPELGRRRTVAIVSGVLAATFLAALDVSIVGTAMPTIVGELRGFALYPWVVTAYLLTSTTTIPLYGRLADLYGRKRILLAAITLFLAGSALCGLAQSMLQLVLFRALQGLGAGGIIPVTLTVLGDLFPLEQRARLQGLTSAVWGAAAVAGPSVGAAVTDLAGWRWIFYLNVPVGLVALGLLGAALQERVGRREHPLDYRGALLLTVGMTLLLSGLSAAGEGRGAAPVVAVGATLGGAALLVLFWRTERRAAMPIVPPELVRRRLMAVVALGSILIGAGMFGLTSFLPLAMQGLGAGTATTAGLTIMPFAVSWSVASTAAGRVILRFGFRSSVVLGMGAMLTGALVLQVVPRWPVLGWAVAAAALFGIGMGFSATAFLIAVQNAVAWGERGIATALVGLSRTIGGAVGVAVLGAVLNGVIQQRLGERAAIDALLDPAQRPSLSDALRASSERALAEALSVAFLLILLVVTAAVALVVVGFPREVLAGRVGARGPVAVSDGARSGDAREQVER
jgi:EmrB/QacA subfamily drug resistance transporter